MKKFALLAATICCLFFVKLANGQNPVATLEHGGTTQVFYGQNAFIDAYNASINGDIIYLSAGYFNRPYPIEKGINIIGSGHFPDSANIPKRTYINGLIQINKGSDNLSLEGLYINEEIRFDGNNSINGVKITRCRSTSISFNSVSTAASKDNCTIEECFVEGGMSINNYIKNLHIRNSILTGSLSSINGDALIENNIFLKNDWGLFSSINSSIIKNNIIVYNNPGYNDCIVGGFGNWYSNNIFVKSDTDFGSNTINGNYQGVAKESIFINQSGNSIDYTHNYHLKNPELYLGTDGTQVGLYGGTTPFKDKGKPSNPQITSAKVDNTTDKDGKLSISFTVEAQQ